MSAYLAGLATAVPACHFTQQEAAEYCQLLGCETELERQFLREVYRKSGVRTRHSVVLRRNDGTARDRQSLFHPAKGPGDCGPSTAERMAIYAAAAGPLAAQAAARAMEDAAVPAEAISHLVTVSCTGFVAPGFDVQLIQSLGLPPSTSRTHLGFMGCHGALNGIRVAKAFADAQPHAVVLLAAVELCTLHQQYGAVPELIVSNALFADGAGSAVIRGRQSEAGRERAEWTLAASGSYVFPNSLDDMGWNIGNHGFVMKLSKRVPELIERDVPRWLKGWLAEHRLGLRDIATWAVHPGGPRILESCAYAFGLSEGQLRVSRAILAEYGNMSSPTVLFILDRLRQSLAPRPCLALAFGPGLTAEAVLLT